MRNLIILFVLFFAFSRSSILHGQSPDFDHYKTLQCEGSIPTEFITLSSEKVKKEQAEIEKKYTGKEKQTRQTFSMQSNFGIDELLTSGRVIFNDQVSNYIRKVAEYVLRDQPEVFKQLKFYAVRTPSVNAFATHNGYIFVNLGLIAQLNTESELAFVLSHEIQHYLKKHSVSRYVEAQKIKNGAGLYKGIGYNEKQLAMSRYSKEQESEADLDGLELFKTSAYSRDAPNRVMDVLAFSYLPYDDVAFDSLFFETEFLKFPGDYHLRETAKIEVDEEEEDAFASHPNIAKRREEIAEKLAGDSTDAGIDFLFGEDEFLLVRKICRFESLEEEISHRSYENAIYNSWLLLHDEPESFYLKKTIVRGLYGLAKYKNGGRFYDVHYASDEVQGESQALYHFFEQMGGEELNTLALIWAWKLYSENKSDIELSAIVDDLFKETVNNYHETMDSFATALPDPAVFAKMRGEKIENPDSVMPTEVNPDSALASTKKLTKYEKIKMERDPVKKQKKEASLFRYGLVGNFKDEEFNRRWEELKKEGPESVDWNILSKAERKQKEREMPQNRKLGAKKIIFLEPIYISMDQRSEIPVKYFSGEQKKQEYTEQLKENAKLVGLKYEFLDVNSLSPGQVDRFNDFSILSDWLSERMGHDDIRRMVSTNTNDVKPLIQKYGTPYFAWTGILTVKEKDPKLPIYYIASIVYPFVLPYAIYRTVTPLVSTYYFTLVYDLEKGELGLAEVNFMKKKPMLDYSTALIYRTLDRINSK